MFAPPRVCTTLCMHCLVCGPPNLCVLQLALLDGQLASLDTGASPRTPSKITRLLWWPQTAVCLHHVVYAPPGVWTDKPPLASTHFALDPGYITPAGLGGGSPQYPPYPPPLPSPPILPLLPPSPPYPVLQCTGERNLSLRPLLWCTGVGNMSLRPVLWCTGEGNLSLRPVLWYTGVGNLSLCPVLWYTGEENLSLHRVGWCTGEGNLSVRPVLW